MVVVSHVPVGGRGRRMRGKGVTGSLNVRVGSWNIGSLTGKSIELVKILKRRKINIACVQETRWVGAKARDVDGFKLWYSGGSRDRNGVGILVDGDLREQVVEVRRINDRLMTIKLVIGGSTLSVISAYAPQVGLDEEAKKRFYEELDEVVRGIPNTEKIVIGGDFNGHIGATSSGFDDVHGGFGFGVRNGGGTSLLDFAKAFELVIANSCFQKENHLVIPSEYLTTQHKLLVLDLKIKRDRRRKTVPDRPRIKWGGLTSANSREMGEELVGMGAWSGSGDADNMWNKAASCIREVASKVLGVSRGKFGGRKGDWWWNGEVQSPDVGLGSGGEKKLYRLAKARERKARDLDQVKCIKDEEGKILVEETAIKQRWRSYFHKLLNEKGKTYVLGDLAHSKDLDFGSCRCVRRRGCTAINRMSREKRTGPMRFLEFWKSMGKAGIEWLTGRLMLSLRQSKMLEEWRWSTMVPLRKEETDMVFMTEKAYDKVPGMSSEAIKDMYAGAKTSVRTNWRRLGTFPAEMGRTVDHPKPLPICFGDGAELAYSEEDQNVIFGVQVECVVDEADVEVRLAAQIIPKKEIIQGSGDIGDDVTHRISLDEVEACLEVLCDKKIPRNLKMRMLRWMCGHTRRAARIRNERRALSPGEGGREVMGGRECSRRGRGRPKKYWEEDMTLDRKEWRSRIRL
ncbi:hypothetical protein H5410_053732 [Solanum commersonii]|uniref:Endonuclease/exonuclease/phosphatase domain-containing protein n=1 Tax=Solanum commersonii TaxID=4109 RepID=A0A9J5X498_SOLCO|nr:hypothetical protein H5410_053732 [Solanum commersonii]